MNAAFVTTGSRSSHASRSRTRSSWAAAALAALLLLGASTASASVPDPAQSNVPPVIPIGPTGIACFDVVVRDFAGNPLAGVIVTVEFSCSPAFCAGQPHTGNTVTGTTNSGGSTRFCICASSGNCTASVFANGGQGNILLRNNVPVASAATVMKFYSWNNGNFLSPCTTPNAVCCGGPSDVGMVTAAELSAGYHNAQASVLPGGGLHLVFLHETALSDGTIPIPIDYFVGEKLSEAMGYDSVYAMRGRYNVSFSTYGTYGEVTIPARVVQAPVPTMTEWGAVALMTLLLGGSAVALTRRTRRESDTGATPS